MTATKFSDLEAEVLRIRQGISAQRAQIDNPYEDVLAFVVPDTSLLIAWGIDVVDGVVIVTPEQYQQMVSGACPECGETDPDNCPNQ